MHTVKIIQICLLAACLSNELHEDDLEMAGMRRAIEQSTKEPYKAKPVDPGVRVLAGG